MTSHADESQRGMPITPSMPDVMESAPIPIWKADDYLLVLMEDLNPISAHIIGDASLTGLSYPATLVVIDRRSNFPRMYITLERSVAGLFFCCFTEAGIHENHGLVDDASLEAFTSKAFDLFRKRFGFSGELAKAIVPPPAAETSGPN
jgi:hypothetical protein